MEVLRWGPQTQAASAKGQAALLQHAGGCRGLPARGAAADTRHVRTMRLADEDLHVVMVRREPLGLGRSDVCKRMSQPVNLNACLHCHGRHAVRHNLN